MKRGLAKTGFSMVEVLVAVGILAILSIGLFFVTGHARKQAERALVESTLVTLDTALQQYYDFTSPHSYPPECRDTASSPWSAGTFSPVPPDSNYVANEALYYYLNRVPTSKAVLARLNDKTVTDIVSKADLERVKFANVGRYTVTVGTEKFSLPRIIDAWKNPLQYQYRTLGNFPVIRSFGPDGDPCTLDDIVNKRKF